MRALCQFNNSICTFWWLLATALAMVLSTLMVPMQSPDENSHIARAYLLSKGEFLLQDLPDAFGESNENKEVAAFIERARKQPGRMGGMVDEGLFEFIDGYMGMAGRPDNRFSTIEKMHMASLEWTDKQRFYLLPGTGYYFPIIYAPQAIGLGIGRLLNLSVEHSYHLAKGMTLLACFAMLWLAFSLVTPSPIVLSLLLLPMSLFQMLSPTLDGLTTSLAVLAISLFLWSLRLGRQQSAGASWGLALCVLVLATSRTHLMVLLALPFFVAWRRHSKRDLYLGFAVMAGAFAWTLFALQSTTDVRIVRQHSTLDLLLHYANHPLAFIRLIFATLSDHDLFNFYQQSFIGILGWLDAPLVGDFYLYLWAGLALCAVVSFSAAGWATDWSLRAFLVALALSSVGMIFLALLVTWTPHPALLVQGVQGRYFIVPAILLSYALSGFECHLSPPRQRLARFSIAGFAMLSITALTLTLLSRYH